MLARITHIDNGNNNQLNTTKKQRRTVNVRQINVNRKIVREIDRNTAKTIKKSNNCIFRNAEIVIKRSRVEKEREKTQYDNTTDAGEKSSHPLAGK